MGNYIRLIHGDPVPLEQKPEASSDELLALRQELPPRHAAPLDAQMEMAWLNGDDDLVAVAVAIKKALGR